MVTTRPAALALGVSVFAAVALLAGLAVPGAAHPGGTAAGLAGAVGVLAARAGGRGVVRRVKSTIQAQSRASAVEPVPPGPREWTSEHRRWTRRSGLRQGPSRRCREVVRSA